MSDQGEMLHAIDNKLYREVEGDLEVVGIDEEAKRNYNRVRGIEADLLAMTSPAEYKYFDKYPELDDIPVFRRGQYLRQLDKMPEAHHSAAINAFLSYEQQIEMKEREREEKQQAIDAAREKLVAHLKQSSKNGRTRK